MPKKIFSIQAINIEDIPDQYLDKPFLDELVVNGGNVITVDTGTPFADWLVSKGFVIPKRGWDHSCSS